MKKNIAALIFGSCIFSTIIFAEDFTSEDMISSTKIAADTFKKEIGEDSYKKIFALQLSKSPKGSRVKIYYRQEDDSSKSIDYFCHYHDAQAIDCHQL